MKLSKSLIKSVDCPSCKSKSKNKLYQVFDHEYQTSSDFFWQNQCKNCNLVFLSPRPNIKSLNIIYPRSYNNFSISEQESYVRKISNKIQSKSLQKLLNNFGIYDSNKINILDVGCGDGFILDRIKDLFPNINLYGIEPSREACVIARKKGHTIFNVLIEDYRSTIKFDVVFSSHVIEHVADINDFLRQIKKVTKDDGYIVIDTPNIDCFQYRIFGKDWGGHHAPRHWTLFDKNTLNYLAINNNLEVKEIKDIPINLYWIWSIHSYLYRRNFKWFADTFFHTSDCLKKRSLYYFALLCFCEFLERATKLLGGQLGQLRAIFKNS